jgi:alginate O-acetyltransferase complex protein AlgJ
MNHKFLNKAFKATLLSYVVLITNVAVSQTSTSSVVVGKDDWLFTRYEFATPDDAQDTQATISLLTSISKLFEQKGIALVMTMVPSKIKIHSEFLPDGTSVDAYTAGKYESAVKVLQTSGVNFVNLNQPFLASQHRRGDTTIFLHQDTHWSHTGALLAAETIKAQIDKTPALKATLESIPEEKYTLTWATNKVSTRARDLVKLMPKDSPAYPTEKVLPFKVGRVNESKAGLLGGSDTTLITVIGSSYANKNTGYPDGLRYTLQRNLLDISIPVDQGPWVGMEAYLRDDAFKTNKPKLIIWEIPERELRSPPNYKYRDARYVIENNAWLSNVTELLR